MSQGRTALLATCLALPLALGVGPASAAQPEGGQYVYVPAGAVVLLVPAQPVAFPIERVFAEQQAMMRNMLARMDAMMATPMPDPQQMIRSVLNGGGSGVIVRSFSSGNGTCRETITYGPGSNGGQPVVQVAQSGDACGAVAPSASPVEAPVPAAPQPAAPHSPRLWTIGNPPHPIATGLPPRT